MIYWVSSVNGSYYYYYVWLLLMIPWSIWLCQYIISIIIIMLACIRRPARQNDVPAKTIEVLELLFLMWFSLQQFLVVTLVCLVGFHIHLLYLCSHKNFFNIEILNLIIIKIRRCIFCDWSKFLYYIYVKGINITTTNIVRWDNLRFFIDHFSK